MDNVERFTTEYAARLYFSMKQHPGMYAYTIDEAPLVVAKMITALKNGVAHTSPTIRDTCKALGIRPTHVGISAYLNG